MAQYLPPINNYPIFDSESFMTSDLPISHAQAIGLLCNYPTAQGAMTFTGNTTIIATAHFNGALVGTANTNITVKDDLNITTLTPLPLVTLTNNSTVLSYTDSGTIRFTGAMTGNLEFNYDNIPGLGLTHTGGSSVNNLGTYENVTNTVSTYNNNLIGTNLQVQNIIATDPTTSGVNITLNNTSITQMNILGNITALGTFNAPRLFVNKTLVYGKYPLMIAYGGYDYVAGTNTATVIPSVFNCTYTYIPATRVSSVLFSSSIGSLGNFLIFYNLSGTTSGMTLVPVSRTTGKSSTGFTFSTDCGSAAVAPVTNCQINWMVYL